MVGGEGGEPLLKVREEKSNLASELRGDSRGRDCSLTDTSVAQLAPASTNFIDAQNFLCRRRTEVDNPLELPR